MNRLVVEVNNKYRAGQVLEKKVLKVKCKKTIQKVV